MRAVMTSNFRELCQEFGISAKTGYKWRQRFFEHGFAGMDELSRRPKSHADELREGVVCEIVKLRRATHGHPPENAFCNARADVALGLHSCRALSSQLRDHFSRKPLNGETESNNDEQKPYKCYLCSEPKVLPAY
jgi:hypothetical protein